MQFPIDECSAKKHSNDFPCTAFTTPAASEELFGSDYVCPKEMVEKLWKVDQIGPNSSLEDESMSVDDRQVIEFWEYEFCDTQVHKFEGQCEKVFV